MTLEDSFEMPETVVARKVDDELIILDLAGGAYFGLDPVGARIWALLREGMRLGQIRDAMLAEYDVSRETIERDLRGLVATLQKDGLIRPRK